MGANKNELFTVGQNEIAAFFKALSHPARIAILEYLIRVDACVCGDIVDELPLAQPTVSQHLRELKNAGLIKGNIEGTSVCYCVEKNAIQRIRDYFSGVSQRMDDKSEKCC